MRSGARSGAAQPPENHRAILIEFGRGPVGLGFRYARHLDRIARDPQRADRWIFHRPNHLAGGHLIEARHIGNGIDRRYRDASLFQHTQPMCGIFRGKGLLDLVLELIDILTSQVGCEEAFIILQIRAADRITKVPIEFIVAGMSVSTLCLSSTRVFPVHTVSLPN